jgi:hypothetical protein
MQSRSSSLLPLLAAALLVGSGLVLSCGGGDGTSNEGSISLSVSPTSASVQQGGSVQVTGTITRSGGFSGTVSFAVSGSIPTGLTGSVGTISTSGNVSTATITLQTTAATPAGTYPITVTGSGSGVSSSSVTFTLTVTAAPVGSYTLTLNPATTTVTQGSNTTVTVNINRTNFPAGVTLTAENLPNGVTASFNPVSPVTANSTVLTLTASATATTGTTNVTIRGSTPGLGPENAAAVVADQTVTLTLTVNASTGGGSFTLSAAPATLSFAQGGNGSSTITINRTGGFAGDVALSVTGQVTNMTASVTPTSTTGNTATLNVTTTSGVAAGNVTLTITGTSGSITQTTTVTVTITAAGSFTLSAAPATLSFAQGGNGSSTITINRTGGFAGDVALSVTGQVTNMTATVTPTSTTGNTATLNVTTTSGVAAGNVTLTITGTSGAITQTTTVTVTITAAGSFTLSAAPATLSFAQGGNGSSTITINRTGGFAGNVALSVTGQIANMTATITPTSTTGTTATLNVTTTGAVATGLVTLTITGTSGSITQTTTVAVTVTSTGGGGNVTVSFAACAVSGQAIWFAGNNNGTWTQVTGVANVYTFSVSGGKGGYAYVTQNGSNFTTTVIYLTQTELTSGTINICGTATPPTGRTVTGTAAGFGAGLFTAVNVAFGGSFATASPGVPGFTLQNVANGAQDLVMWRSDLIAGPSASDRGLIERGLNPANNQLGTKDMTGGTSFAAATGTATITGLIGGENITGGMSYAVGPSCFTGSLYSFLTGSASQPIFGVPAANQMGTDFHSFSVFTSSGTPPAISGRTHIESFHTLGNRTIDLAPNFTGTVSIVTAPYKALQVAGTIPTAYNNSAASLTYYTQDGTKSVAITASPGWIGGTALTLGFADLTAQGYLAAWATTGTVTYTASVAGFANFVNTFCAEGATVRTAFFSGQM